MTKSTATPMPAPIPAFAPVLRCVWSPWSASTLSAQGRPRAKTLSETSCQQWGRTTISKGLGECQGQIEENEWKSRLTD